MCAAPDQASSQAPPSRPTAGRVLVTGARGFVGRHLAAALQADGAAVDGLDLPVAAPDTDPDWLVHRRRLGAAGGGDDAARELAACLAAGRYEVVYHLAGQSSAGASFQDPAGTVVANLLGTLELLEALRLLAADGARPPLVIAVGSAEEYGAAATTDRPCREDDPVLPLSPYGTSKAAATQLCGQYHRGFGLPVLATRSFNHTGPGQDSRFVFPSFAAQIAAIEAGRQEPVLRTGDLTPVRDFLDVRDVVAAYRLLAEHGRPGRVYNVCSGSALTIGDGLRILLELAATTVRVATDTDRLRPADIPRLVGDPGALRRETGWRPRHTLRDTMRDLLEEARRNLA
jgi:GDP-4-dehydro-6-deoxy-D-mannose reductase